MVVVMVLKFFDTLDSVAEYIEKEENKKGVYYIRRSVGKSFGSDSKFDTRHNFGHAKVCGRRPQRLETRVRATPAFAGGRRVAR